MTFRKTVGILGGSSIFEIGSSRDLNYFFRAIENQFSLSDRENFLLKRFYLKYLSLSDLAEFHAMMTQIKENLTQPNAGEDRSRISLRHEDNISISRGDKSSCKTFNTYFDAIDHCVNSALFFQASFNLYKPVRICLTDMPDYLIEKMRPLTEYDALNEDDTPFWLR